MPKIISSKKKANYWQQWDFNIRILIPCLICELHPHTPVYQIIHES